MKPRLLALDLDGTLLPRSKRLSEKDRDVVRAVRAAGIEVVLATGKTVHLAGRYADELELRGPIIALDGSWVREWPAGETFFTVGIPAIRAAEAIEAVAPHGLLPFLSDAEDRLLLHTGLSDWSDFLRVYSERIDLTDDPSDDWVGDPHFVAFLGTAESVRRGAEDLAAIVDGAHRVFAAEFLERGTSLLVLRPLEDKGAALERVAARMGIPREEVMAAGDWKNDVSMIAWAGIGVAMANAHPAVVEVADVLLPGDSETDALAEYLTETCGGQPYLTETCGGQPYFTETCGGQPYFTETC